MRRPVRSSRGFGRRRRSHPRGEAADPVRPTVCGRANVMPLTRNGSSDRLGSLSVNVFSVAHFYDVNQQLFIVDGVQDKIR
jgi:hypothetical protein